MSKTLKDDNTSKPSVKKVECIERHVEPVDERVVARSHNEERDLSISVLVYFTLFEIHTILTTAKVPVRFLRALAAVAKVPLQGILSTQKATLVPR